MPLPLRASTLPTWVLNGATFDFDFIKNRNWGCLGISQKTFFDTQSPAADGGAYAAAPFTPTKSGVLYKGATGQNRITDLGFFAERASTNYCYFSRDLTQSASPYWNSVTSITALKNVIGADGAANSASTLTATGSNASIYQTVTPNSRIYLAAIASAGTGYVANEVDTLTGGTFSTAGKIKVLTVSGGVPQTISINNMGVYTVLPSNPVAQGSTTGSGTGLTVNLTFESFVFSAWVKRITGSGAVYMTTDGGSTQYRIDSLLSTTGYTWISGMAQVNGASTYQCGFQIATSGDAIAVDFCQFEPVTAVNTSTLPSPTNGMPTTPLPNTNSAGGYAARGNNTAYWQNAAVVGTSANMGQRVLNDIFNTNAPWSMVMSFNGDCTNNINHGPITIASDMTCPTSIGGGGGSTFGVGAPGQTTNSGNNGRGNWNVVAIRCNKKGTYVCLNGGAIAGPNTTSPNWLPNANVGSTHFNLGNNGSGTADTQLNGSIGRVTFFNSEISDAEMINYTDLSYGYGQF